MYLVIATASKQTSITILMSKTSFYIIVHIHELDHRHSQQTSKYLTILLSTESSNIKVNLQELKNCYKEAIITNNPYIDTGK